MIFGNLECPAKARGYHCLHEIGSFGIKTLSDRFDRGISFQSIMTTCFARRQSSYEISPLSVADSLDSARSTTISPEGDEKFPNAIIRLRS